MTRGSAMTETRWSMDTATTPADASGVESISSYRPMYRHATPVGASPSAPDAASVPTAGSSISPDHHMLNAAIPPSMLPFESSPESFGFSPSDWVFRSSTHHHHYPMDLTRVHIKPNATNTTVSRSESDIFKRTVNERLDRYMVIRQRTFHGLPRSRRDLSTLPLTDPRETQSEGSTPTWLHRSKTDLYIERWRSKKNRQRSDSGTTSLDLSGMTVGSLYESLPSSRLEKSHSSSPRASMQEVKIAPRATATRIGVASNGSETRFPPLSTNTIKQSLSESGGKLTNNKLEKEHVTNAVPTLASSPTKESQSVNRRKSSSSKVLKLPSENDERKSFAHNQAPQNRNDEERNGPGGGVEKGEISAGNNAAVVSDDSVSRTLPVEGDANREKPVSSDTSWKSRGLNDQEKRPNKDVAAIPLQLWEPTFDNSAAASHQRVLQPRHLLRAWQQPGGPRHGALK